MSFSPLVSQLVDSLQILPGVGPKSAQRMALSLLEKKRESGQRMAQHLLEAIEKVGHCSRCRTLSENTLCQVCSNTRRQTHLICVVETPMDMMAIESMGIYRGVYFVLQGRLSPLDGIGPDELKLSELTQRLQDAELSEVILALNPSIEGEATAHYLISLAKKEGKSVSRIAYGVPFGGELEYVDGHTLTHAFSTRQVI